MVYIFKTIQDCGSSFLLSSQNIIHIPSDVVVANEATALVLRFINEALLSSETFRDLNPIYQNHFLELMSKSVLNQVINHTKGAGI